jgi:cytochrome c
MAHVGFRKPIQLKLGADGTLYVLEFGDKWFDNRDAQLVRIIYRRGNRPPEPKLRASVAVGKAPLVTKLDATQTIDRDGDQTLTWAWRLDGKVVAGAVAPALADRYWSSPH